LPLREDLFRSVHFSIALARTLEVLKRSVGMVQKENIDLHKYKDSVPWFPAAQDEDGETFKASQVVFALPTFAIYAPFKPPPSSFVNKTSLAL
jgi:hypothetical protein